MIGFGIPGVGKPYLAIVNHPTYMVTVPPKYTAYQGFDTLFHNTGVMMSTSLNILSGAIALSAIDLHHKSPMMKEILNLREKYKLKVSLHKYMEIK